MKYFEIFRWEARPLIYSTLIAVGITIVITILETSGTNAFVVAAAILYLLILAELYVNSNHYHIQHRAGTHAVYQMEESRITQFLHHLFLPSFLYLGIILFLFFNNQPSEYMLVIVLTFGLFTVLFENINSFYKHKLTLNKQTHYIYDFLSIVLVFIWTSISLDATQRYNIQDAYLYLGLPLLLIPIFALTILRHKVEFKSIVLAVLGIILISVVSLSLFLYTDAAVLFISFIAAFFYQAYNFALSHYIEGKTDKYDLLDYFIVLVLVLSLIGLVS